MIFPATNSPLYTVQLLVSPEGIVKSDRQMARLYVIGRDNTTGPLHQSKHYIIIIYNFISVGTYTYTYYLQIMELGDVPIDAPIKIVIKIGRWSKKYYLLRNLKNKEANG